MQSGKSLKDQGKSRTTVVWNSGENETSQSLKDQGKSRTFWAGMLAQYGVTSQSLKDQGKSRTPARA